MLALMDGFRDVMDAKGQFQDWEEGNWRREVRTILLKMFAVKSNRERRH